MDVYSLRGIVLKLVEGSSGMLISEIMRVEWVRLWVVIESLNVILEEKVVFLVGGLVLIEIIDVYRDVVIGYLKWWRIWKCI